MKYVIYCIAVFCFFQANAQNSVKLLDLKEVKVGELMPDIPLGEVANNYTGKTRFSEFKGKLVILDFWYVNCSSCIDGFPKMSKLQKEFGDTIQIFLVNPFESQAEIDSSIKKGRNKLSKIPIPGNLPSITAAKQLFNLFPGKGEIGYYIWIGPDGVVKLRGNGPINTYEEKIRDLLSGKKISYVTDEGVKAYKGESFYKLSEKSTTPFIQYSSSFAKFNPVLAPYFGNNSNDYIKDTVAGTVRNTNLNKEVLQYYFEATNINDIAEKGLLSQVRNKVLLFVNDTVKYTHDRKWYYGPITDKVYSENRFSYEQIVPINLTDSQRRQYMLEDLNLHFGRLYGAEGKIEKRKMPCYLLVRTSNQDKLKTKGTNQNGEYLMMNDRRMIRFTNVDFGTLLRHLKYVCTTDIFSVNDILLDETDYTGMIDILIPQAEEFKSIEDLRAALKVYDLDIIKGEREVKMLVIKEKDYKGPNK